MSEGRKKRKKRGLLKECRFVAFKNGCYQCVSYGSLHFNCEQQRFYGDADGRIIMVKCANPWEVDE